MSHSYAHDLLLCESTLKGCDCAACDVILRRIHALDLTPRDTSLCGLNLLDAPTVTKPRATPTCHISPAALYHILHCDPIQERRDGLSTSGSPTASGEAHLKLLPAIPTESSSGHDRSNSSNLDTTTSSGTSDPRVHTHSEPSLRRSVRRVPVPQECPDLSELKPRISAGHAKVGLSELSRLLGELENHDPAANYLALQVIGALNFQKRAVRRADSDTWSTLVVAEEDSA